MNLYVWHDVLRDYTAGMIVAIAPDLESALAAETEEYVRAEMGRVTPEVVGIGPDTTAQTWHVWGGS